jgi:murein DD-endopeptidase MepM/ murein hydrolase activator NlpD
LRRVIITGLALAVALALAFGFVPTGGPHRARAQLPLPTPTPTLDVDVPDLPLPTSDPDLPISPEEITNGGDDATQDTGGTATGGGGSGTGTRKDGSRKGRGTSPSGRETATEQSFEGPTPAGGFFVGGGMGPIGDFDTDRLVRIASTAKDKGMSSRAVLRRVFSPFIIGGRAAWSNTWGAPRFGPAPGQVRTHQGQDVFCDFGAPVLATVPGRVSYGDGGIGGKVARVHTRKGGYWYYAHLSGWNQEEFATGDRVEPGDLIGWCGNTGNATRTSPHVHFGHYQASGSPANPMRPLVKWLRTAVSRSERIDVATRSGSRPDATAPNASEAMLLRLHDLPELAGEREGEG